ncbi:pyridoxal phosphate-dependent aminotransferase [Paenibacillus doosanensis]|uniref:MalY/PatB family protein n=1 Tax=Paenibacillus doosanensis TaxID=1229154 RepID=UPI0021808AE8|nr:MalY/PatB family protein [Paenibacillus doosanensis]MCS7463798.1 pyridoxal phosphate-dependent aminotransferase [Paenibacillus doosanensis]
MKYDFDRMLNRKQTNSYKWDQSERLFGADDVLPLWVADMDFESPPAVKEALVQRALHGTYGYSIQPEAYNAAIVSWFARRHDWQLKPEWLSDAPGVVTTLSLAVELFSSLGDRVLLQSPVYAPFFDVIRMNGREVADSPLIERDGRYIMNYDQLEQEMQRGAKLMLLCSPHNPGGRVWEREELERLGELCIRYGVTVISDEIHCDLVMSGHRHIPFASLSEELAQRTMTALAATKTFNLAGLHTSFAVTANSEMKKAFDRRLRTLALNMTPYFNANAVIAAYNEGEAWLDELLAYLEANRDYAIDYLSEHLPQVKTHRPDGTYLLWVDCRGLTTDVRQIKELMFRQAKVAFNEGSQYGSAGEGFVRINYACPRSFLHEALERFCRAAQTVESK